MASKASQLPSAHRKHKHWPAMILHGYFRSSASYRVRIALSLKGLSAVQVTHHLCKGEQRSPEYLQINPQGLVPSLIMDGGNTLTQSLAIIEWLEETYPEPALLPADRDERARVRAFALAIACDVHPVQNLKVLQHLRGLNLSEEQVFGMGCLGKSRRSCSLRSSSGEQPRPLLLRSIADSCRHLPCSPAR